MIVKTKGEARARRPMIDWEKGIKAAKEKGLSIEQIKDQLVEAFSKYLKRTAKAALVGEKIRGVDPNLEGTAPIVELFSDPGSPVEPDRGYEAIFTEVNMRQSTSRNFELLDIVGGISFYQQKTGEEAKLSVIGDSSKTSVEMLRFTGGINILDDYIRFNEWYKIEEIFNEAIIGWWDVKAELFYGLMELLDASIDVTWDTDLSTTINNACADLLKVNKTKSALKGRKRFVITCPEGARFKVAKALAASFKNANSNTNEIVYSIQAVVPTTYFSDETNLYVSIPAGKSKRGEWDDFHARPATRDELKGGEAHVWTGAYNGVIGDKDQHRRVPLSA